MEGSPLRRVGGGAFVLLMLLAVDFVAGGPVSTVGDAAGRSLRGEGVGAASVLALLGEWVVTIPLLAAGAVALALRKRTRDAVTVVGTAALAEAASVGLKLVFARPRPLDALAEVGGYAFPSGHATRAAYVLVLLVLLSPRPRLAAALGGVWLVLVAGSRLVLGVHTLSDVLAGAALGVGVAATVAARSAPRNEA